MFYVSLGPFGLPYLSITSQLIFKPPEHIFSNKKLTKDAYFKADIWAMGVVFCALRYGPCFADQIELIEEESDYLEFCELMFDIDSNCDYTYVSFEHLQRLKKRKTLYPQNNLKFNEQFLLYCKEDFKELILLRGLVNPEPSSRLSSKELLCLDLFKDCQGKPFNSKIIQMEPTLETGSHKHHSKPNSIAEFKSEHRHRSGQNTQMKKRNEVEPSNSALIPFDVKNPGSEDRNQDHIQNYRIGDSRYIEFEHRNESVEDRGITKGHSLTPQNGTGTELANSETWATSESRKRSLDHRCREPNIDSSGYRDMRNRRELMRKEIANKEVKAASTLQDSKTHLKSQGSHFGQIDGNIDKEKSKNFEGSYEERRQFNVSGKDVRGTLQVETDSSSKLGHKGYASEVQRPPSNSIKKEAQNRDNSPTPAYGRGRNSNGYNAAPHEHSDNRSQISHQRIEHEENQKGNFVIPGTRKGERRADYLHSEADLKEGERISKPFFNSTNSNVLQGYADSFNPQGRQETHIEKTKEENNQLNFPQRIPPSETQATKTRGLYDRSMTDVIRKESSPLQTAKFDLERRKNDHQLSNYNEQIRETVDQREESHSGGKWKAKFNEERDSSKEKKRPITPLKGKIKTQNLSLIIKLSVVKFTEDAYDDYKFISGSIVFKKSALEDNSLATDTEIKSSSSEVSLNSIFTFSLPNTKIDSTEEMRVDLTIYGHKEKSPFKRYLSSGCIDIRAAVLSQLLSANGQKTIESKWCLLRSTQRVPNSAVQVEIVVEEMNLKDVPSHREDSLERNCPKMSPIYKRPRDVSPLHPKNQMEIQIKDEIEEAKAHNFERVNEYKTGQPEPLIIHSRYGRKREQETINCTKKIDTKTHAEDYPQSIKPNFSFGKIAGKPVQDQKEALKREIEELRNSIDQSTNLQSYPKALGLLRDLIKKGDPTNHSIDPN